MIADAPERPGLQIRMDPPRGRHVYYTYTLTPDIVYRLFFCSVGDDDELQQTRVELLQQVTTTGIDHDDDHDDDDDDDSDD